LEHACADAANGGGFRIPRAGAFNHTQDIGILLAVPPLHLDSCTRLISIQPWQDSEVVEHWRSAVQTSRRLGGTVNMVGFNAGAAVALAEPQIAIRHTSALVDFDGIGVFTA